MSNIPNLNERYRRRQPLAAPGPHSPPGRTIPRRRQGKPLLLLATVLMVLVIGYAIREGWTSFVSPPSSTSAPMPKSTSVPELTPQESSASAPKFTVRAYDSQIDKDAQCVICQLSDWEGPKSPGRYQWSVTFPVNEPALLMLGWCAIDKQTLDNNWPLMRYDLIIDGYQIEVDQLTRSEVTSDNRVCYFVSGILTGWSRGRHSYIWVHHIYRRLNDGWDTYEAGDYIMEFIVNVQ